MAYHYIERIGFVTRVEDLEGVLAPKLYKALLEVDASREQHYLNRMDEINTLKEELNFHEREADERLQQIRNGNIMLDNLIVYVQNAKRLDKDKLISMLEEVQNDLNNY